MLLSMCCDTAQAKGDTEITTPLFVSRVRQYDAKKAGGKTVKGRCTLGERVN